MVANATSIHRKRCHGCNFEAEAGSAQWSTVTHPPLGTLTQCPECGSTDVRSME